MGQVSCGKFGIFTPLIHLFFELVKRQTERRLVRRFVWDNYREARTDDAGVGSGKEEGRAESEVRDVVSVALWDTLDQPMEPQAPQVVCHPALRQLRAGHAEHWSELLAQFGVG